jgi:hypothetical protein
MFFYNNRAMASQTKGLETIVVCGGTAVCPEPGDIL